MRAAKALLRQIARAQLAAIPPPERAALSTRICKHILTLPEWRGAGTIGVYAAQPAEPDLGMLLHTAGKAFCFPRVEGSAMQFYHCTQPDDFLQGRWGLREPDPARCEAVAAEKIELLIVPGMAFDLQGGRLGHGGGYYDRFLGRCAAGMKSIGVCFHTQVMPEIPQEGHDAQVAAVVTEMGVFRGGQAKEMCHTGAHARRRCIALSFRMSNAPTEDSFSWKAADTTSEDLLRREWIVTNGLGGFSSAAITGALTRRYHGLLVSALPIPHGRVVMLTSLREKLHLPGEPARLLSAQPGLEEVAEADGEMSLQNGLPVWRFQAGNAVVEKRLIMPHQQNTVFITYTLISETPKALLELQPLLRFRHLEAAVDKGWETPYRFSVKGDEYEISHPDLPPLCISLCSPGKGFQIAEKIIPALRFVTEEERGEPCLGNLWSPGFFSLELRKGQPVTLMASTEPLETRDALSAEQARQYELRRRMRLLERAPAAARSGFASELVLAADQFLIEPAGRAGEAALAHAQGDDVRTVIAGYHWFTDWGRDTMISLEGLTLDTGRPREAGCILRTFSRYVKDGLIPNMFPEGQGRGLYHTADATLWFFHALSRYIVRTHDRTTLRELLPVLAEIMERHVQGTHFNIHMDPKDALLIQGQQGYQLTWMDAKTGERVVTPRRGKAVEINALWYNALILLGNWLQEEGDHRGGDYHELARRAKASFNARFWSEEHGHLFDVVEGEHGDDPACRPNQVFAISLPNPVLDESRWRPVMEVVKRELLTPVGLRSLSPKDPEYKQNYHGDLWARDAAYHQGTVWPWLIGPYVDATLKVHPEDKAGAREALQNFQQHWREAGLGTISEIFDAEEPHIARGCIAQAWSVAEVLRVWLKTE